MQLAKQGSPVGDVVQDSEATATSITPVGTSCSGVSPVIRPGAPVPPGLEQPKVA